MATIPTTACTAACLPARLPACLPAKHHYLQVLELPAHEMVGGSQVSSHEPSEVGRNVEVSGWEDKGSKVVPEGRKGLCIRTQLQVDEGG